MRDTPSEALKWALIFERQKSQEGQSLKVDQRPEPFALDLGSAGDRAKILNLLAAEEFIPLEVPAEARVEENQRLWYVFPQGSIQAVGAIAFHEGEWNVVSETRLRRWARDLRQRITEADRRILEAALRLPEWENVPEFNHNADDFTNQQFTTRLLQKVEAMSHER